MKEKWLDDNKCTACGACVNICPVDAIKLEKNNCGFEYPKISKMCIDCNSCQKVCENRDKLTQERFNNPKTYATWSKDEDVRFFSTSGGAFSEISRVVLGRGGYVVGAQYRDDCLVEHIIISDEDGLARIRQSKYVQSEIGLVFREIKKLLLKDNWVAFCGAPCQVAGLYAYLGKCYDKLITMDFICRGMNSSKAYRSWLDELEDNEKSKVKQVWFKYKVGGWKKSPRCTRVDFANGNYHIFDQDENIYMMGYLAHNLYIRPSCGECEFKGVPREGDITLADFWGLDKTIDDDKGASMILINSTKGESIFREAREKLHVYERTFEEIFAGNVCFESSVVVNPKSEVFLRSLDDMKFSEAVRKYSKQTLFAKVKKKMVDYIGKIKRVCGRITNKLKTLKK